MRSNVLFLFPNKFNPGMINRDKRRSEHVKTFHKCFSLIVYSLLIIVLFGSVAELSFAATEEHTLAGKVSAYMTAHEDSTAGVATVLIKNDEVIYKAKGFADFEQQTTVDE